MLSFKNIAGGIQKKGAPRVQGVVTERKDRIPLQTRIADRSGDGIIIGCTCMRIDVFFRKCGERREFLHVCAASFHFL